MLVVKDLEAGYGKLQILMGISFTLDDDKIMALIGANGSGKTTVLRAIMNLVTIYNGSVIFDGVVLTTKKWYEIARLGVAFVPQRREVFAPLTVQENLEVGGYRLNKKDLQEMLKLVISIFPRLEKMSSRMAGFLSGGEQKMLAIARGLMSRPKLLLLDEPSLGLAPSTAVELFAHLQRIRDEWPALRSMLVVEQNAALALEIADQGLVLENGQIVLAGSQDELVGNPLVKKAYLSLGEEKATKEAV